MFNLRRLEHSPVHSIKPYNINVIIIPDYNLVDKKPSPESAWKWLWSVPDTTVAVPQVLILDTLTATSDSNLWQAISQDGSNVLRVLEEDHENFGIAERPFLLVAHGLGGILLKQVISDLHQQYHRPIYHRLISLHAGDIFLGTPHVNLTNLSNMVPPLTLFLRAYTRLSKRVTEEAISELRILASICTKFEQTQTTTKVINVYEGEATKLKSRVVFHHRRVVVDRELASISNTMEHLISAPADHHSIMEILQNSPSHHLYLQLLHDVVSTSEVPPHDPNGTGSVSATTVAPWSSTADDFAHLTTCALPFSERLDPSPEPRRNAVLPCYKMDPFSRDLTFFGRLNWLDLLADKFLSDEEPTDDSIMGSPSAVALTGLGGTGKSSIAIEFAFRYQEKFDAIFLLRSNSAEKLSLDFTLAATKLGIVNPDDKGNAVVCRNILLEWLCNPDKGVKWLIIFDDADETSLLQEYWPLHGSGAIIITSRNGSAAKTSFYSAASFPVDSMTLQETSEMLIQFSNFASSEQSLRDAKALAKRLRGFPLALLQMSSYARSRDMNFAEITEMVDGTSLSRTLHAANKDQGHNLANLATSWASYAIGAAATDLLQVMSFLDPDCIPEALFQPSSPPPWRSQSFYSGTKDYINARTQLLRYSLIRRNESTGQVSIHRLVQEATRLQMGPDVKFRQFELAAHLLHRAWPVPKHRFMHDPSMWLKQEPVARHIPTMQATFETHPEWNSEPQPLADFAEILTRCACYHREQWNFALALRMLNVSLKIAETHAESMKPLLADIYVTLASTYSEINEKEKALEFARKHLPIRLEVEKTRPFPSEDSAMAYSELAYAHLLMNQYAESITLCEVALEIEDRCPSIDKEVYWPYSIPTFHAWGLIGLGRVQEATKMMEQTVALGGKRWRTASDLTFMYGYALFTLGCIRFSQRAYRDCVDMLTESYAVYKKTTGLRFHHVGLVCMKLAETKLVLKELDQARLHAREAAVIFGQAPHYNAELARAVFLAASAEGAAKNSANALLLREEAAERYCDVTGKSVSDPQSLVMADFDATVSVWAR